MFQEFNGLELKLLRLFYGYTLDEVAISVDKSRQYLHKLETGQTQPTTELLEKLAAHFKVEQELFSTFKSTIQEEQAHFRSLKTARKSAKQSVIARADYMMRLIDYIELKLELPEFSVPTYENSASFSGDDIERVAEECRRQWGLGLAPISNMNKFCEKLGIIVTSFSTYSEEVDALSLATRRPIIVRNNAKTSVCRQRFDLGHELGHLILHDGMVTGDRFTEGQAHRFAGAFLLPRTMLASNFHLLFSGKQFKWKKMSEFKGIWRVSKAAILYRARQLGLLTEAQYVMGTTHLKNNGEALRESEDVDLPLEQPQILKNCFTVLAERKIYAEDIAKSLNISVSFLEELVGFKIPESPFKLEIVNES